MCQGLTGRLAPDRGAGDLLLRLNQARDHLGAVTQGRGLDEDLMHRRAEHRWDAEGLGHMSVVTNILAREVEPELEAVIRAREHGRDEHLEDSRIGRAYAHDLE